MQESYTLSERQKDIYRKARGGLEPWELHEKAYMLGAIKSETNMRYDSEREIIVGYVKYESFKDLHSAGICMTGVRRAIESGGEYNGMRWKRVLKKNN